MITSNNNLDFPKQYYPLFDSKITEIIEPSGRSSGKSTSNEIAAIYMMTQSKYNNIWYCRAEKSDIRSKILSSTISTIQMLGLEKKFKWSISPFEITCLSTGAKMYFDGINGKTDDDLAATKGFVPQYKTLKMCILDEADEVKHPNHVIGLSTTANKFLLPGAKMVYAHNPTPSKAHWANKYFGDKIRNGATRIYATWEDIRRLLKPSTISEIEKFKRDDPLYYRFWYLGEQVGFRGMVYPQFNRTKHIVNIHKLIHDGDRIIELLFGIDEGTANDSTCVTVLAVMLSGRSVVLDCFEIDPQKIGQQAPTEQSRLLKAFLDKTLEKFNHLQLYLVPRRWIFECAEGGQMLRLQFESDYGISGILVTEKSVMGDVKRIRSMLQEEILLFHVDNNVTTSILIDDIENYVFDEKTNEIKKQQRDDTIDSLEYATKLYYNVPMRTVG